MELTQDPNQLPEFSMIEHVDVQELNLKGVEGVALVQRFESPAKNLGEAARLFDRDGAAVLDGDCKITVMNEEGESAQVTVEQFTAAARWSTIGDLQNIWDSEGGDDIIALRDFADAYNGTERHMRAVSYKNIGQYIPDVLALQRGLTPTIREIARDPTVEVSDDPDEGTVINLQVFDPKDPLGRQEHGAHTDRVDTTTIICLDNVGPQGDFVYLKGYNAACEVLGIDPHRNFPQNMTRILAETPTAVIFRLYPVQPGKLSVIRTDQDVHFITAKSMDDVLKGKADGHKPALLGELIIGRGVINAAFETAVCRAIDVQARQIEEAYDLKSLRGDAFFETLDKAIADANLSRVKAKLVINAAVTRMSADQLYHG